ncbi:recombinase family protein [Salinispora mooreana]|uniref:recombinase family protein n=1 Tax=Salinispora mooreana TaxID=999545 RepID=UPI0009B74772|nr:recombinase family protein [Salinispora mooreana]
MSKQTPPAGYARVSLFLPGAVSDEAQKSECNAEAARRGLSEPVWYVDVDRTASDERKPRPAFDQLMADVKAGKVKVIISRSSDRFVRRPRELESIIDVLSPRHVPVYFTRDSDYDLSTAGGRETARIKASIARGEVERMSERMKSSAEERARRGVPRKGNRPFGYTFANKSDGTLTFTQVGPEAEAIRWAFDYVMSGGTLAGVAREWTGRGFTTAHGKVGRNWSWLGVKQAVLNPAVGGFRYYQPTSVLTIGEARKVPWECDFIPGNWKDDSILSGQEWRDLRTVLTSTRQKAGNRKRHLGSGIYLCGLCDDGTTLKSARRGGELMYRCREKSHLNVPGQNLDAFILEMVRRALVDRDIFEASFGTSSAVDAAALDQQRKEAQKQLDQLEEAYAGKRVSISVFERTSRRLEAEITDLDDRLSVINAEKSRIVRLMSFEEVDRALEDADLTQRRQLVADIYPKVIIRAPGKGRAFNPEYHVRMIDRAGREWPTWLHEWSQNRQLNSARALVEARHQVGPASGNPT